MGSIVLQRGIGSIVLENLQNPENNDTSRRFLWRITCARSSMRFLPFWSMQTTGLLSVGSACLTAAKFACSYSMKFFLSFLLSKLLCFNGISSLWPPRNRLFKRRCPLFFQVDQCFLFSRCQGFRPGIFFYAGGCSACRSPHPEGDRKQ